MKKKNPIKGIICPSLQTAMQRLKAPKVLDMLYNLIFGKYGIQQVFGMIVKEVGKIFINISKLVKAIFVLATECNPVGFPKMLIQLAVDIGMQIKDFMFELSAILNSGDEEAALDAAFMGKSHGQFLKRQLFKIPGRMMTTGRAVISIPSSTYNLVGVIKMIITGVRDGFLATPVVQIYEMPRLKLQQPKLTQAEREAINNAVPDKAKARSHAVPRARRAARVAACAFLNPPFRRMRHAIRMLVALLNPCADVRGRQGGGWQGGDGHHRQRQAGGQQDCYERGGGRRG